MPITYVSGDPLLTQAQILAFGHNVKGRTESGVFETLLLDRYPAAFATYSKSCRSQDRDVVDMARVTACARLYGCA
jgi:hypothetical protein